VHTLNNLEVDATENAVMIVVRNPEAVPMVRVENERGSQVYRVRVRVRDRLDVLRRVI
jgi:hypothetical protein